MERRFFSLEMHESNLLTKVFMFIMGILCIAIAIYWLIDNFRNAGLDWTSWISSLFLILFGAYMVYSASGYSYIFVEFKGDTIRLKNNSILPVKEIRCPEIERIVVYPLKFEIVFRSSKKIITRFGITDIERNEVIKDEILKFAKEHKIKAEIRNET